MTFFCFVWNTLYGMSKKLKRKSTNFLYSIQKLQKALNKFEAVPEENSKWLVQKNTFVYNIFSIFRALCNIQIVVL